VSVQIGNDWPLGLVAMLVSLPIVGALAYIFANSIAEILRQPPEDNILWLALFGFYLIVWIKAAIEAAIKWRRRRRVSING